MPIPPRPTRLGPYEVIVKIAGGGMATIYLGRGQRNGSGERLVALKVIRNELRQDDRFEAMFLDEARTLSRLSHPNIAATYEFGTDDEQHFIAMELLVGRTVFDVWNACKERKLSFRPDHAAWIGARVAHALHHAHELKDESGVLLGLIHRDVNPSNIFLTLEGEVKLFDFGLAKSAGRQSQSVDGIVKGKLPYLCPEQVAQQDVDRRSDSYMLATTLWEMTTMRRLFKREDDVATVMAVRAGLIPDPRARMPDYPEALWLILRRALARDPDDRYATAAALAEELDGFVASQGRTGDMPDVTASMLDALFPGEREQRAQWLRRARGSAREPGTRTIPPPLPMVGATRNSFPPGDG